MWSQNLQAPPRNVRNALDFATLNGEHDLSRAVVSRDNLELRSQQGIIQPWCRFGIDADDPANDQLPLQQVFRSSMRRRCIPCQCYSNLAVEAGEPMKLVDLKASARRVGKLGKQHAALDEGNRRPISRRGA